MNAKGLVAKYLKSQGIAPKKNDLGLNFNYEGWNFLLWNDTDDLLFFRLILPGVFDVTDDNYAKAIMTCNNVNWNYKVVKAVLYELRMSMIVGLRCGCVSSRYSMPIHRLRKSFPEPSTVSSLPQRRLLRK